MYFMNRFFIENNLHGNSKVGSQFHCIIDHLAIHLFDHNHFMLEGSQISSLSSWFSVLSSQVRKFLFVMILLNVLHYHVSTLM